MKINLSKMSISELEELQEKIEKKIKDRKIEKIIEKYIMMNIKK